jgi:putative SOS response-associated peptidase YedK
MARAVGDLMMECGAEVPGDFGLKESYNVAPTDDVPIVLERLIDGVVRRQLHIARWGLVPRWAKEISVGTRSFNARIESAAEKPTFQDSVHTRRCAVPVDGYYEWKKLGAKTKQPYFVHRGDHAPIFFAGLYGWWKDPSKALDAEDAWLLSTTGTRCRWTRTPWLRGWIPPSGKGRTCWTCSGTERTTPPLTGRWNR